MKDYLNEINALFPIRRRDEEKNKFYNYVRGELGESRVKRETLQGNHNNIIIGDPTQAQVVFTAHYDTPGASLVPNLMFPASKIIGIVINLIFPIVLALLSVVIALAVASLLGLYERYAALIYVVLYFGLFYCTTRLFPNKHNKNDNTSGVATVMSLATQINDGRVAFILFDNEEKGLLGSKAYTKKYNGILQDRLIVNFDCVGNGDQMIYIVKEAAEKLRTYNILKDVAVSGEGFEVHHLPYKKCFSNSDYKNFPCGVGVMASRRAKIVKFFTGRIHTSRDTVASEKNVFFLVNTMKDFISKL